MFGDPEQSENVKLLESRIGKECEMKEKTKNFE